MTEHVADPMAEDAILPLRTIDLEAARFAGRTLTNALILEDEETFRVWCRVLVPHIPQREREAITWMALSSLDPCAAEALACDFLGSGGAPVPTFYDRQAEAELWAAGATTSDHMHYAAAAFTQMSRADRSEFLEWTRTAP